MAEFGIATGALQAADAGLKLAKTLYNYLDGVRKADSELRTLAREVTVTSTTLSSLGRMLEDSNAPALYTQDLVDEAKGAFSSCKEAFQDVDNTFKSVVRFDTDGKGQVVPIYHRLPLMVSNVTSRGRWAWPLKKGKVDLLQANVERLKTTLLLMLSVLTFARTNQDSTRKDDTRVAVEKIQIDTLIQAQQDAVQRYDELVVSFARLEANVSPVHPTRHGRDAAQPTYSPLINMANVPSQLPLHDGTEHLRSVASQHHDAVHSQLSVCASAVTQLAQALSVATNGWQSRKDVGYEAISLSYSKLGACIDILHSHHLAQSSELERHDTASTGASTVTQDDIPRIVLAQQTRVDRPAVMKHARMPTLPQKPAVPRGALTTEYDRPDRSQSRIRSSSWFSRPPKKSYPVEAAVGGPSELAGQRHSGTYEEHIPIIAELEATEVGLDASTSPRAQSSSVEEGAARQAASDVGQVQHWESSQQLQKAPTQAMPAAPASFVSETGNHALDDYQMQLFLLKQQNEKSKLMARLESEGRPRPSPATPITPIQQSAFGLDQSISQQTSAPQQQSGPAVDHQHGSPPVTVGQPFGQSKYEDLGLDFGRHDSGDGLDNFDFESFLSAGDGDSGLDFDANFAFGPGLGSDEEGHAEIEEAQHTRSTVDDLLRKWTTISGV